MVQPMGPKRAAILFALVAVPWAAHAAEPSPVDEALRLYRAFEYEQATAVLEVYTKDEQGRGDAAAFALLGQCYAVVGRTGAAEDAFDHLLELDPSFTFSDDVSPRIRMVFSQAKNARVKQEAVERRAQRERLLASLSLDLRIEDSPVGGRDMKVVCDVVDPSRAVHSVRLVYQKPADVAASALAMTKTSTSRWTATLPAALTVNESGLQLRVHVQTYDAQQRPLLAEPAAPDSVLVEVAPGQLEGRPLYKAWWFWTIVGGVAVAGVTTWAVIQSQAPEQGDLPGFTFP